MKSTLTPLTALCLLATACDLKQPGNLGELTSSETSAEDSAEDTGASEPPTSTTNPDEPTTGEPTTDADTTGEPTTGEPAPARQVDVLFVIDNSGSMAPSQTRIADAIDAFVDPITGSDFDLRIAVTTTDNGNPRCPNSAPESGGFVASSCRARVPLGEFEFQGNDHTSACFDACFHNTLEILPTTTASDPVASPRPWVEWSPSASNVEIPLAEALACMIPQGVAGCGFESQLESMHRAISRMTTPSDPAAGFLRDDALFLAVIVTDEMDCSYNPDFQEIFTPDNTVFWNSPDDIAPTSAVCWRAGMACTGGPGEYDSCAAVDHDESGAVTSDPDDAVLRPLSRYTAVLDQVQASKPTPDQVQLVVIGGVPSGYPENPLVWADDMTSEILFGIDFGCEANGVSAVPPGRMIEVVEAHSPLGKGLFSICESDLGGPLAAIAASIVGD